MAFRWLLIFVVGGVEAGKQRRRRLREHWRIISIVVVESGLHPVVNSPVDNDGEEIAGMVFVLGWRRHFDALFPTSME